MNKVREWRTARSLSQAKLAHAVGCTEQTIYNIERGGNTTVDFAQKLARVLAVKVDDLFPAEASADMSA